MDTILKQFTKGSQIISKPVENVFNVVVKPTLNQPIVQVLVSWIVIVSIILAVKDLSPNITKVLTHPVSRTSITFLGLYIGTNDFSTSLLITILLMLVYYLLVVRENFELIHPTTDTYPGCSSTTVDDLLKVFDNDINKLKKIMYESGVPLDLELNNYNAPLIATYLINFGHQITEQCSPPQ